jgi:membrane-associated protease RseP (regulator of RpoE activity)
MFAATAIALTILSLMFHEAGHAIAMMRRGVEIEEAGLGWPLGKRLKITLRPRFLPFPVVITPLLIGAYVRPSKKGQERIEELSYKDQAVISGAGIIANVLFGAMLVIIAGLVAFFNPAADMLRVLTVIGVSAAVGAVFWQGRRWISYVMPVLGVASLALIVVALARSLDSVGGPIAVYQTAESAKGAVDALLTAAALSVGFALINMLPFSPLDGARTVSALLVRRGLVRTNEWFTVGGTVVFVMFFVFMIGKDVLGLLH